MGHSPVDHSRSWPPPSFVSPHPKTGKNKSEEQNIYKGCSAPPVNKLVIKPSTERRTENVQENCKSTNTDKNNKGKPSKMNTLLVHILVGVFDGVAQERPPKADYGGSKNKH